MKVVHLQYHADSAGKQALRLSNAFNENGINSKVISLYSDGLSSSTSLELGKKEKLLSKLDNRIQNFFLKDSNKKLGLFSYPILGSNISKHINVLEADIIYIHWVLHGFLNFKSIKALAKLNKPIVIFMHDMWAITGGCHYSFDCNKYETGCGSCPIFFSLKDNDLSRKEFEKKSRLYDKFDNLYYVSPSTWLHDCSKKSLLTKNKPSFYIPNIADSNVYKSYNKKTAKNILNIEQDETIIAFGAMYIDSPYKGYTYLLEALKILSEKNQQKIRVLVFGSNYNQELAESIPFPTKFMGYMKDDYSMSLIYNAADVFVAPSLAEAFGLVIFEAICCGTPVVGFNVGGIPDLIKHKINGYLAKYKDAGDLAEGIKFCLHNKMDVCLDENFTTEKTIAKHIYLLEKLLVKNAFGYE